MSKPMSREAGDYADIEVQNLPRRLRCGDDYEQARRVWGRAVTRYFRNHREGSQDGPDYLLIARHEREHLDEQSIREMAQALGEDLERSTPPRALMNWVWDAKRAAVRFIKGRLESAPSEQERDQLRSLFNVLRLQHIDPDFGWPRDCDRTDRDQVAKALGLEVQS